MEYLAYQDKMTAFGRLLRIMDELREQCPWDRKQTWTSLRNLSIEEMYELADALLDENVEEEIKSGFFELKQKFCDTYPSSIYISHIILHQKHPLF